MNNPSEKFNIFIKKILVVYITLHAWLSNKRFFCNALTGNSSYNICINSDLTISCNCQDYHGWGHIGDLKKEGFSDIFSGKTAQKFRLSLANGRLPIITCTRCSELRLVDKTKSRDYINNYSLSLPGIMVENTSACNLNCLACEREKLEKIREKMALSLDDMKKVSSLIKNHGIKHVNFFNLGEPFFSRRISEEIELLRNENPDINILLSTNGVLLDSDKKRKAALKLDWITFSIDGSDQDSLCKYQRGGDFDKAYNNMKTLVRFRDSIKHKKPIIEWKYILFNWNDKKELILKAIELAKQAGVDRLSFVPTLSPFYGISLRYFLCSYLKNIGKPHPSFARGRIVTKADTFLGIREG